jgi:hypothetical protein
LKEAQDNILVVAKTIEVYVNEVKQATNIVKPSVNLTPSTPKS